MQDAFLATLTPMLTLFVCIAVGFTVRKTNIVDRDAGKTVAKLVTWVFCPALNFASMSKNFTVETLGTHAINITLSVCGVAVALAIAIPLSRLFVREATPERGIYAYALAFANSGYMGDPVVQMLLGDQAFAYYKLFCIPIGIGIYSWGMAQLVPRSAEKKSFLKSFLKSFSNAPMAAILLGVVFGLTGLGARLPVFVGQSLDILKGCMGPAAMLVAGFTIANYSVTQMLKKPKVYAASLLRLTLIPAAVIAAVYGIKLLMGSLFSLDIDNNVLYLLFFAVATPLGLNTVVFPEAYGGNPETGAGMAMISHTLCVLSIPLMYSVMVLLFGAAAF